MVAYRFRSKVPLPVAERVPIPTPKSDEVLLKILASGVCHSDLSALDPKTAVGRGVVKSKPFTFGHEGAGQTVHRLRFH